MRATNAIYVATFAVVAVGMSWLGLARSSGLQPGAPTEDLPLDHTGSAPAPVAPLAACQAGCSVGDHPITPITRAEFEALIDTLSAGAADERERALETLLFHGERTRELLGTVGTGALADEAAARLHRELSRKFVALSFRLVDEHGVVRAAVDRARFPIGVKQHVHVESTRDLPAPEISGTVHRTGVHHLWTRL